MALGIIAVSPSRGSSRVALELCREEEEAAEKQKQLRTQEAAQCIRRLKDDSAYRHERELAAQQITEEAREVAFRELFDYELWDVSSVRSWWIEWDAHKKFWEWERRARGELVELRESERVMTAGRKEGFVPESGASVADRKDDGHEERTCDTRIADSKRTFGLPSNWTLPP
jgi:hypothetical protein